MNLEQAFILDTPEKISKVVDRLDYFTLSEKMKLGTLISAQCEKLNCKISCPKAHKSFINANYVHTYIEDEFMPEKIAKEIDDFCNTYKIVLRDSVFKVVRNNLHFSIEKSLDSIYYLLENIFKDNTLKIKNNPSLFEDITISFVSLFEFIESDFNVLTSVISGQDEQDVINTLCCDCLGHFIRMNVPLQGDLMDFIFHTVESRNHRNYTTRVWIYKAISHQYSIEGQSSIHNKLDSCDGNKDLDYSVSSILSLHDEFFKTKSLWEKNKNDYTIQAQTPTVKSFREHLSNPTNCLYDLRAFYDFNYDLDKVLKEKLPKFSFKLSTRDLFIIEESKYFEEIFMGFLSDNKAYFGKLETKYFLIGKNKKFPNQFMYIDLLELKTSFETRGKINFSTHTLDKIDYISESMGKTDETQESITEGIDIDKNGVVTFSFSKKKSFMDQYGEVHRMLVADNETGNYEGMKISLAYLFSMISVIERDYIYTDKKIKSSKLEDAKKARMFAYNDFKTYNTILVRNEPTFNFTQYYHDEGYDKMIFKVTPDTLLGIKKLFNTIMYKTIG